MFGPIISTDLRPLLNVDDIESKDLCRRILRGTIDATRLKKADMIRAAQHFAEVAPDTIDTADGIDELVVKPSKLIFGGER